MFSPEGTLSDHPDQKYKIVLLHQFFYLNALNSIFQDSMQ